MSRRTEPTSDQVARELEAVDRLRRLGAQWAGGRRGRADDEPPVPPGGWAPILDDDGNVIPDPPPTEPTDVPAADVEAARAEAD